MRSDGQFTLHKVVLPSANGRVHTLIPFGDVHFDSPAFAPDTWKQFLERSRTAVNPIFLGMGDYLDSYSYSERMIMSDNGLHDTTRDRDESLARGRVLEFVSTIKHLKGSIIGVLCGNHYPQFSDGTTGDQLIASELGAPFLGECAAIRIGMVDRRHRGACSVDIFAHHGTGSGRTTGGRMNAVDQLDRIAEADIFLMGHNHARGALPTGDKLRILDGPHGVYLRSRRSWIGRTGSFMKSYEPGVSSYVVHRALPPSSLGWIEFEMTMRRIREDGVDRTAIEIHGRQ